MKLLPFRKDDVLKMYIHRYCNQCKKLATLSAGDFYCCYEPDTKTYESRFICPRCGKHSENKMPDTLTKDELEDLFRNFQIIKDHSAYNQNSLYPVYWVIYKNDNYITCYGTCNEEDFFNIIK